MKIVDTKVMFVAQGRSFVTLKLVTEDGVYGLGDATLNECELAVASYSRRIEACDRRKGVLLIGA